MTSSTLEFKSILIEKLTLGVIKSIGKRQGVCDVALDQKGPADTFIVNKWESDNCCTLPADLKEFYQTSDGFLLTWKVKLKEEANPVGRMEINPLNKLHKITGLITDNSGSSGTSLIDIDLSEEEDPGGTIPHFDNRSRIFELDPSQNLGKMCLVYRNTKQGIPARDADYWFLDKALRWHFVTDNFASYFRLMLTNLGLPQWQYLFTDIGVTPSAKQWYHLYTPMSSDSTQESPVALSSNGNTEIPTTNIDINRVFKGKEKKKPPVQGNSNQNANQRRKTGSPQPNKGQLLKGSTSSSTLNKQAANSTNR